MAITHHTQDEIDTVYRTLDDATGDLISASIRMRAAAFAGNEEAVKAEESRETWQQLIDKYRVG